MSARGSASGDPVAQHRDLTEVPARGSPFGYLLVRSIVSSLICCYSVAVVIAAFGGLLIRESGRHFMEADTAEDVALALQALAPFYAGSDDTVRLAARQRVGVPSWSRTCCPGSPTATQQNTRVPSSKGLVEQGTSALKPGSGGE